MTSVIGQWLQAQSRRWRAWIASSDVARLANRLTDDLRRHPVQALGVAGIAGLLANTAFTLLWGAIGWRGALLRLIVGAVCAAACASTVSWRQLKASSVVRPKSLGGRAVSLGEFQGVVLSSFGNWKIGNGQAEKVGKFWSKTLINIDNRHSTIVINSAVFAADTSTDTF